MDYSEIYNSIQRTHERVEKNNIAIIQAANLSRETGVLHGFTTRLGGVSEAPFDSMNMSMMRNDPPVNVDENFIRLCNAYGLDYNSLAIVNHEHGTNILRLDASHGGKGLYRMPFKPCDGFVTNDPGVTLVTIHADCSAVFLYDRELRAIGLAHAGWKGTLGRIGQKLAERMGAEFGSKPENLLAAIGPCICFDCFEVDHELGERFRSEFNSSWIVKPGVEGKAYVDIRGALVIQLLDAGLQPKNISIMDLCTYENKSLLFSYRRDSDNAGAMAAFMKLK